MLYAHWYLSNCVTNDGYISHLGEVLFRIRVRVTLLFEYVGIGNLVGSLP
jgi:hypothetical protein